MDEARANGSTRTLPSSDQATDAWRALGFAIFLHAAWAVAWLLNRSLEPRFESLATGGGSFTYWFSAKFLLWVVPAVVVIHASGQPLAEIIGVGRARPILLWGGGAGLILGSTAFLNLAAGRHPQLPSHFSWPLVNVVLVAPTVEELAFRGAILQSLKRRYSFARANSLTALLFLTIHMVGWSFQGRLWANLSTPVGGALSIFAIGLVLGYVAQKSHSVAASMLTHLLNNVFSALFSV